MNYYIYTFESDTTKIYNRISNSAGISVFPDIVFAHPFEEAEITDDTIFDIAQKAISEYGSSNVIIASVAGDEDRALLESRMDFLHKEETGPDDSKLIALMSDNLMLTEAMRINFCRLLAYYRETGNNPEDLLAPFMNEYPLPVANKNEGKKIYELIRNKILG